MPGTPKRLTQIYIRFAYKMRRVNTAFWSDLGLLD